MGSCHAAHQFHHKQVRPVGDIDDRSGKADRDDRLASSDLLHTFEAYDMNQDGQISRQEFRLALHKSMCAKLKRRQERQLRKDERQMVQEMVSSMANLIFIVADKNKDDMIDYREFVDSNVISQVKVLRSNQEKNLKSTTSDGIF
eukprot:805653_1